MGLCYSRAIDKFLIYSSKSKLSRTEVHYGVCVYIIYSQFKEQGVSCRAQICGCAYTTVLQKKSHFVEIQRKYHCEAGLTITIPVNFSESMIFCTVNGETSEQKPKTLASGGNKGHP